MFNVNTKFKMKAVEFNKNLPWIVGSLKTDFKDHVCTVTAIDDDVMTVTFNGFKKRVCIEPQFYSYFEIV